MFVVFVVVLVPRPISENTQEQNKGSQGYLTHMSSFLTIYVRAHAVALIDNTVILLHNNVNAQVLACFVTC